MNDDTTWLVVIPYLARKAQGREIVYAIYGWRRHFLNKYHIVVVGDNPHITGEDITFIDCPKIPEVRGQYLPHLDFVNKFKAVLHEFPNTDGFIFCCDDYYAVNDFTIEDVLQLKMQSPEINFSLNSTNKWRVDAAKTRIKLRKGGYPTRNFTTHLPQYYEWHKLIKLWDDYDMQRKSLVMEDLYFNIYYPDTEPFPLNVETDNIKFGLYEKDIDEQTIRKYMEKKIWITNSPVGWSETLDKVLKEHYRI